MYGGTALTFLVQNPSSRAVSFRAFFDFKNGEDVTCPRQYSILDYLSVLLFLFVCCCCCAAFLAILLAVCAGIYSAGAGSGLLGRYATQKVIEARRPSGTLYNSEHPAYVSSEGMLADSHSFIPYDPANPGEGLDRVGDPYGASSPTV
jgi:hypothetical protein